MQRAHLLCDYTKAKNPTRDVMEDLEANVVEDQVTRLVGAGTVVVTRNAIEVFLASYCPDLMSSLFPVFVFYSCLGSPLIARALS